MPTIYITNWSSRKMHGPGRLLTIMALPRAWEHGDGVVPHLTHYPDDFDALQDGDLSGQDYRERYLQHLTEHRHGLVPGGLFAWSQSSGRTDVVDGDTLLCACSRHQARQGWCHRVWAANALAQHGWEVVLDGQGICDLCRLAYCPCFPDPVQGSLL